MSNNGGEVAAQQQELLETREFCSRAGITRNQFIRLRDRYPILKPARRVGAGLALWPASLLEMVKSILANEAKDAGRQG